MLAVVDLNEDKLCLRKKIKRIGRIIPWLLWLQHNNDGEHSYIAKYTNNCHWNQRRKMILFIE